MKKLFGKRYGRLVVEEFSPKFGSRRAGWYCQCDCGSDPVYVLTSNLTSGHTQSCGCLRIGRPETHGMPHTRLYKIWKGMKNRCYNSRTPLYRYYGAKGVSICFEWRAEFVVFYAWASAHGYEDVLEIDRVNPEGDYEPTNCRWVTRSVNARRQKRRKQP